MSYIRTKEIKEKTRQSVLKYYYTHPEVIKEISRLTKEAMDNPTISRKCSIGSKRKWMNPKVVERYRTGLLEHHIDGDNKNNNSTNKIKLTFREHFITHRLDAKLIRELYLIKAIKFNRNTKRYEVVKNA